MTTNQDQPSELAQSIAKSLCKWCSAPSCDCGNESFNNAVRIIDAKLAEFEAVQWKNACEPPDNGRFVFARDSDSGDVREAFFLSEPLSGNRSWRDWSNGSGFHADKWREYVIPDPPKPPKAKGAK